MVSRRQSLLAALGWAAVSDAGARATILPARLPPLPQTDWFIAGFVDESVELDANTLLRLDRLIDRLQVFRDVHFGTLFLHSVHEQVVSGMANADRDKRRVEAINAALQSRTGHRAWPRFAPLQPMGERVPWPDGTFRVRWYGHCRAADGWDASCQLARVEISDT